MARKANSAKNSPRNRRLQSDPKVPARRKTSHALKNLPSRISTSSLRRIGYSVVQTIPSWVILTTIILATCGVLTTVIVRTQSELQRASSDYEMQLQDLRTLRNGSVATKILSPMKSFRQEPPVTIGYEELFLCC